jgi:hypothetical protein
MVCGFYAIDTVDLSMRAAIPLMVSLTYDPALVHKHRSYHRVGRYMAHTHSGEVKAARHKKSV